MFSSIREKPFYKPLVWILAGFCLILFFLVGMQVVEDRSLTLGPDFIPYWSAGKLNLLGGNPYDPSQLHPLQDKTGIVIQEVMIMWNPPWFMPIAMLFGLMDFGISRLVWFFINCILIFISINKIWDLYGGEPQLRWLSWLIGFTFVPILSSLKIGQTSALLLIGIVGFLHFNEQKKFWVAGFFLSLLMVKPHILYLILLAVLLWSIHKRELGVILGTTIVLTAASAIAIIFNPNVFQEYLFVMNNLPPIDWATPTLGSLLRIIFGQDNRWLQLIPLLLGMVWFTLNWLRKKDFWKWKEQAPLLILVSTLTAPYSWTWDLLVSIVPILQVAILLIPIWREKYSVYILISYLMIDIIVFFRSSNQFWVFWLAPALLVLYLVSQKIITTNSKSPHHPAADPGFQQEV